MIPIAKIYNKLSCCVKKGKDRTNKLDNVNLIYNIPCSSCGLSYVGESKSLSYRIGEQDVLLKIMFLKKLFQDIALAMDIK